MNWSTAFCIVGSIWGVVWIFIVCIELQLHKKENADFKYWHDDSRRRIFDLEARAAALESER